MKYYKFHYTYRITNIVLNKHYYGSRSTNTEPQLELGFSYISSSKDPDFIKDQKENPQNYKYKIIKIFETRMEATQLEIDFHSKFNVAKNESFYNNSNQTSTGFMYGFLSKSHSEKNIEIFKYKAILREKRFKETGKFKEIRNKISINRQGKNCGEEHKKTKNILIFDDKGVLIYKVSGSINEFCKEMNLPIIPIQKSYLNNG